MTNEIRLCCQVYHQYYVTGRFRSTARFGPLSGRPPESSNPAVGRPRSTKIPRDGPAVAAPRPLIQVSFERSFLQSHFTNVVIITITATGWAVFVFYPIPKKLPTSPRVTLLSALEHIIPKKLPTPTPYSPKKLPTSRAQIQFSPTPTTAKNGPKRLSTLCPILCQFSSPANFTPCARPRQPGGRKTDPTARNDQLQDGHPDYRSTISAAPI